MKVKAKKYLKNENYCPFCGSRKIQASPIESDTGIAWADVWCDACDEEWRDLYNLVGVRINDKEYYKDGV